MAAALMLMGTSCALFVLSFFALLLHALLDLRAVFAGLIRPRRRALWVGRVVE